MAAKAGGFCSGSGGDEGPVEEGAERERERERGKRGEVTDRQIRLQSLEKGTVSG
jgi:hypothetical protein